MSENTTLLALLRVDIAHDGLTHLDASLATLKDRDVPSAVILDAVKAALSGRVDADAERVRTRVLTTGAGQALEYQETQAQAAAALKAPSSATAEKYPMLAASLGIDVDPETGAKAQDILGVARSVQAARDAWLAIGSAIRGTRLKAKAAIATAATVEEAAAAYNAIDWLPLPG